MLTLNDQRKLMCELRKLCKTPCEGENRIRDFIELHQAALIACWACLGTQRLLERALSDNDETLAPKINRLIADWRCHIRYPDFPSNDPEWVRASETLVANAIDMGDGSLRLCRPHLMAAVRAAKNIKAKWVMFDFAEYQVIIEAAELSLVFSAIKRFPSVSFDLCEVAGFCGSSTRLKVRWSNWRKGRQCSGGLNLWLSPRERVMDYECVIVRIGHKLSIAA